MSENNIEEAEANKLQFTGAVEFLSRHGRGRNSLQSIKEMLRNGARDLDKHGQEALMTVLRLAFSDFQGTAQQMITDILQPSSTNQPVWKFIANIGDASPAQEGGVFIYEDTTGVYPPEVEVLEVERRGWTIHRIVLSKCTYVDGVLSDNKFHPDKPAWFADRIESVARTHGEDVETLIGWLCSSDARDLADGYRALWENFGLHEFDSQPWRVDPLKDHYQQKELG